VVVSRGRNGARPESLHDPDGGDGHSRGAEVARWTDQMTNRSLKKLASSWLSFASERRVRPAPISEGDDPTEDGELAARDEQPTGEAVVRALNLAQVAIRDFDGTIRFWSEGMERLYAYTREEAVGQSFHRLLKTEFPRPLAELEAELLEQGQWSGEISHRRRDGAIVIVTSLWIVVRDGQGRPQGIAVIHTDITEQKRGDQARLHLAAIVESSDDAIIGITLDGIITSWNRGAAEIFGYAADEILGRSIITLVPPDRLHEEEEIVAKISRGEKVEHHDTVRRRKDGVEINVSLTVSPIRDPSGMIVGASKIARDLTSRQTTERRLEELQVTLIHVSRLNELGQMGSALSHELNQPLAAIANYIETGRRWVELQNPAKAIESLGKAMAQVDRAGEIIQHLRQFVQKGGTERRRESINQVIEEASALALIGARQQAIRTILRLASSAPHAMIDKVQIQQVVVNLIRNSIEAMVGADQRLLTIGTALIAGRFVEVSVSDTGSGLPEEIMATLFQPFVSTKSHGMGIGLSISRSIIQAHGGDLRAEQNLERGATFRFTLPLDD
jgi:two-component system, LuxR family, sensor kinase FixL